MRRLDEALTILSGRGEVRGADQLLMTLDSELSGEPLVAVTKDERRGAMVSTKERPFGAPKQRRIPSPAIGLAAFAVIVLTAGLLVWLLPGGGGEVATSPTTTQPALLNLTFDGENCTYEGPTELKAGPVEFVFTNEAGVSYSANIDRIVGGHTIQDAIDDLGEQPAKNKPPAAFSEGITDFPLHIGEGETQRREVNLEAGVYQLVCFQAPNSATWYVWHGTGLTVSN
jgi:hypothetical protein